MNNLPPSPDDGSSGSNNEDDHPENVLPPNLRAELRRLRLKPDDELMVLLRCFLYGLGRAERLFQSISKRTKVFMFLVRVVMLGGVIEFAVAIYGFTWIRDFWQEAATDQRAFRLHVLAGQQAQLAHTAQLRADLDLLGRVKLGKHEGRVIVRIEGPPREYLSEPGVWAYIYDAKTGAQPEAGH